MYLTYEEPGARLYITLRSGADCDLRLSQSCEFYLFSHFYYIWFYIVIFLKSVEMNKKLELVKMTVNLRTLARGKTRWSSPSGRSWPGGRGTGAAAAHCDGCVLNNYVPQCLRTKLAKRTNGTFPFVTNRSLRAGRVLSPRSSDTFPSMSNANLSGIAPDPRPEPSSLSEQQSQLSKIKIKNKMNFREF